MIHPPILPDQPIWQAIFYPHPSPSIPTNLPNIHPTIEIPQKICYTKSDKQSR